MRETGRGNRVLIGDLVPKNMHSRTSPTVPIALLGLVSIQTLDLFLETPKARGIGKLGLILMLGIQSKPN